MAINILAAAEARLETTESAREQDCLTAFLTAMRTGSVLLPDHRVVAIGAEDIVPTTDEDVWCDDFEQIIEPGYEQCHACILETLVNAGFSLPSGTGRFMFVLQNLSQERASGDFFDSNQRFIDRQAEVIDWRKERTFCDAFTLLPRRCMNRLKEKIYQPRQGILDMSENDDLLLRLCYLSLAIKVFLARAGYPEFCQRQEPA